MTDHSIDDRPRQRRFHLLAFVVAPLLLNGALIALFFGPWELGGRIVAPAVRFLEWDSWREFGLLENLQNLYLLVIVIAGVVFARRAQRPWQRWFGVIVAVGSTVVLLEEIDYGLHYYELIVGHTVLPEGSRNLHNFRDNLGYFKLAMNAGAALLFLLIPAVTYPYRERVPVVGYLRTNAWYVITFGIAILVSTVAHALDDAGLGNNSLSGNMSEFREHNVYYLAMVYFVDVFFHRVPPGSAGPPVQPGVKSESRKVGK
jgi:hypothetical protein